MTCIFAPRRDIAPLRSRVRMARELRGLTRRALARATGISILRIRELDEAGSGIPTWPERQVLAAATKFMTQWFNRPPARMPEGPSFLCSSQGEATA